MRRNIPQSPIPVRKSVRRDQWKGLTSVKAGVVNPIAFFPLLREDRLRGRLTVQVRMDEALETIINPIRVRCEAFLFPKLAAERFNGSMETLNRSYAGEPMPDASDPPPWFVQHTFSGANEICDKLGVHYEDGMNINDEILEAYNRIVTWQRKEVSESLPEIAVSNTALQAALWDDPKWRHVKPSFDAALLEGAVPVPLDIQADGFSHVASLAPTGTQMQIVTTGNAYEVNGQPGFRTVKTQPGTHALVTTSPPLDGSISLANIELAKKTQAFAMMRERYRGLSEEYLVDLLMQGIRVPPEEWREPIRLGGGDAYINQTERYATDAANLDVSVTNGIARLSMSLNTPVVNPGGVVMVVLTIVPEQLYERQEDLYLSVSDVDHLPNYLRDTLDPQKVEVVPNSFADALHNQPDDIFGYRPLNHGWNRSFARVGGKFKRPNPDTFIEDRTRIWAIEKIDPTLSDDFYLCPSPFPHSVFADNQADPFEVITIGQVEIVGNTVFGGHFEEDTNAFEKVAAEVDDTRLEGDGTDAVPVAAAADAPDPAPAAAEPVPPLDAALDP